MRPIIKTINSHEEKMDFTKQLIEEHKKMSVTVIADYDTCKYLFDFYKSDKFDEGDMFEYEKDDYCNWYGFTICENFILGYERIHHEDRRCMGFICDYGVIDDVVLQEFPEMELKLDTAIDKIIVKEACNGKCEGCKLLNEECYEEVEIEIEE